MLKKNITIFIFTSSRNYVHNSGSTGLGIPDSKVHVANMGPSWCRQDPGGPHVGPTNLAIWDNHDNYLVVLNGSWPLFSYYRMQGPFWTWSQPMKHCYFVTSSITGGAQTQNDPCHDVKNTKYNQCLPVVLTSPLDISKTRSVLSVTS